MIARNRAVGIALSVLCVALTASVLQTHSARAQNDNLVATLTRLGGVVEVQRVQTSHWIAISAETLIGVGDSIRTDTAGTGSITFFANGTVTNVLPNSEFRIDQFAGTDTQYQLSVTVVTGQTLTRVAKLLDSGSTYTVNSTGLELAVRGTVFNVRVEANGRSSTIVQTGLVKTHNNGQPSNKASVDADVPAGYGVRAEMGKGLSEVVPAKSFAQLDAALDGCGASVSLPGDITINVRSGPNVSFPRVGRFDNNQRLTILGLTVSTGWFRLPFKNGLAWIFTGPALRPDAGCVLLPRYPNDWHGEDTTRYVGLDSDVNLTVTTTPTSTPTPTATPAAKK